MYLDCNATAPIEPEVRDIVLFYMEKEYGNAGSRTHEFGLRAKRAVDLARKQVAAVVGAKPDEVVFTSGATESDNLAILGLAKHLKEEGKTHIISTQIEHKAILEPLAHLESQGFDVELLPPRSSGFVEANDVAAALRPNTGLVSVMHVNNETGVIQDIDEVGDALGHHDAIFHVDAAQGYGKELEKLRHPRIDLISISGHKIYGPKGVGALVTRKRGYRRPPLEPLMYGGGQEYGLRPGTLAVPLIAGLGKAAHLALRDYEERMRICRSIRDEALSALEDLRVDFNGPRDKSLPSVLNLRFRGADSEAVMLSLKDVAAISNGSACTSRSYDPSHVLVAMGQATAVVEQAVRVSWSHMPPRIDWQSFRIALQGLVQEVSDEYPRAASDAGTR